MTIIESLDHEGRGVAHVEGKTIFIEGALPGETVEYSTFKKKPSYEQATAIKILKPSFMRVSPGCEYFGLCGGCSMQHLEASAQVAAKQRVLEDNLWHIGKVKAEAMLPAIYGPPWGYRHRARISVKYVRKKERVLIGFHEKRSSFIADMERCKVLPPRISALLMPLRGLVEGLSIRERMPQIEIALGQNVDALVLRILDPLNEPDEVLLRTFADRHRVQFFLQPKGPETVYPFYPLDAPELNYTLPDFGIVMPFQPTEFTQVNPDINRVLVRRAVNLLDPKPGERIADLFCGLGNFSLPIARRGADVVGVEGSAQLVRRAQANAEYNGLSARAQFVVANLFETDAVGLKQLGHFDKMLIDPPRDGAAAVIAALAEDGPQRIVYVSCSPATLARDAGTLVHDKGYRLKAAGVVNMFPHTAHVESIALFEK
ncbi:MAG: 23S rRNA (uracil(1939)-C(5))-methyltransferase RlmD [Betaproteobacteria bacterium]|nr:23S rRNA (uracil(1939)-C(5))-methyltransferase RlmD [Betaproteobacteria bacterium]